MTDAERGERESAQQELLFWMRKRYAAAALDAARCALKKRGKTDARTELVQGKLTEGGYEGIFLSGDGMTLVRVCYRQTGECFEERAELYGLQGGQTRTVTL